MYPLQPLNTLDFVIGANLCTCPLLKGILSHTEYYHYSGFQKFHYAMQ